MILTRRSEKNWRTIDWNALKICKITQNYLKTVLMTFKFDGYKLTSNALSNETL